MRGLGFSLAAVMLVHGPPTVAQPTGSLPIAQGFWIQATDRCAAATSGYAYDGGRWGQVYYYGPNGSMGPVGEFQSIVRTNAVAGGFTNMKLSDSGELGYFHVKSLGGDRMTLRTGAPSRDGLDVMDDTLVRCDVTALSPKMQAAVKRFAPSLATTTKGLSTPRAPASPWKVQTISTGKLAVYGGTGAVKSLTLSCGPRGDSGELYIETRTKSRVARMPVVFRDDGGGQPQLTFSYFAKQDIWGATASSAVVQALLDGSNMTVELGAFGRDRISLAGSKQAIREAMAPCLFDPGPAPAPAAPLGISPGHYVQEGSLCSDAIGVFYYDGRRYGMIYDNASEPGIVSVIGRPKRVGKGWQLTDGSMVEALGSGRIKWTFEEGSNYRWCPATAIEAAKRVR